MIDYIRSSIPWLDSIPSHWAESRLKDIGQARNGLTYKPEDIVDSDNGTIVLRSSNIQNSKLSFEDNIFVASFPEELRVRCNDVIICSRNGSVSLVGKCALIENDIDATFGAFMMRFRTNINPKFTFYLLQTTIAAYKGLFGTTTLNQLTTSVFGNMLTCIPPLEEQEAIAGYLDKECGNIDRKIELMERKTDAYSRLRRSLINRAVTRGLNPVVPLKFSGNDWIGDIPEHWNVKPLRSFITLISPDKKEVNDYQLLSVTRDKGVIIRGERGEDGNNNRIPDDLSNYKVVRKNQFVINKMKAWMGSYGVSDYEGIVSPAYFICNVHNIYEPFLSIAIRSKLYTNFFWKYSKGIRVDQWDMSPLALKEIPFVTPPEDEQREIVAYLDEKCGKIDAIREEIEKEVERLKELKRSLINEVVTGKRAIKLSEVSYD
ncbi:MAG: restriction endonuclease subunit S [Lachnospiraceae bacterium]|nr:restriction endonuclease subunit S [Lachnospiraceae bacterium]